MSGSTAHASWQDDRDGNTEIYFRRFTGDGASWSEDARLTHDPARSENPSLAAGGASPGAYNHDIFYRRGTVTMIFADGFEGGDTSRWHAWQGLRQGCQPAERLRLGAATIPVANGWR